MLPATGEPAANVARADRLVRRAVSEQGAELVVLPECTLTGYTSPGEAGMTLDRTRELAEPVPGPSVRHFAALARELGVYIVWGLHERRGEKYYNSAVVLSPAGLVMGTYSKVHINRHEQHMGWTNGDRFFVWPCRVRDLDFNLGVMICFDREVPEAARCLTVLGADVIAVPQATGCTCEKPIHRDQLRVRAYENEVFIAMANWAGPVFKGHSMIIAPSGDALSLGGRDEEILFAVLDLDGLRRHRERGIYGRHHRRPAAYGPLLKM
jgi:(R)-amidase